MPYPSPKLLSRVALIALLASPALLMAQSPAPSVPAVAEPTPASETAPASAAADAKIAASPTADQAAAREAATAEPGESGVRIVRLSQVNGSVQMDRGSGLEAAFENLPIVQGNRLVTAAGLAEVEFEDNSSLRLTPNTAVEFPHLALSAAGVPRSELHVLHGTVYASMSDKKSNALSVQFGKSTVTLPAGAHIELTVVDPEVSLRVLSGAVEVAYPGGAMHLGKKKMLSFNSADEAAPEIAENRDEGTYDAWDKRAVDYHKVRASSFAGGAGSGYLYGTSDLAYYGSFVNLGGGCGSLWQPYFVGAGWSPYSNGSWVSYGSAYSWVSPYPWGWAPFHYGSWQNCGAGGWGWNPAGGGWYGLGNVPIRRGASVVPGGHVPTGPNAPAPGQGGPITPRPPAPGIGRRPSTVVVNTRPLEVSGVSREGTDFVFRNGSAGLGVPRQSFGKLGGISHLAVQHGAVAQAYSGPVISRAQAGPAGANSGSAMNRDAGRAPVTNAARASSTAGVYRMPAPASGGNASMSAGRNTASPSSGPSASSRSTPSAPASAGPSPRGH